MRTCQYKIDIPLGGHFLYLIIGSSPERAIKFIQKHHDIEITNAGNSEAFFAGMYEDLFIFVHNTTNLDYVLHEIIHAYQYIIKRMETKLDEESEAYIIQMIFRKVLDKLIQIKKVNL